MRIKASKLLAAVLALWLSLGAAPAAPTPFACTHTPNYRMPKPRELIPV